MAICYKQEKKQNQISDMVLIGDVKNKNANNFDDIINTVTLFKAANLMKERFFDYQVFVPSLLVIML